MKMNLQNLHLFAKYRTISILVWAVCLVFSQPDSASAQLSPGKLSQPHAHLEGLTKCSSCHKLGSREVQQKCVDCHQEIAAMAAGGPGLHAGEDFRHCVDCHVEHQGRDYDLIFWPDGQSGFNHEDTGFDLTGSHKGQDCRQCHTAKYVVDPAQLRSLNKELNRTFLGLDPACTACHQDIHGGQFKQTCTACHDTGTWKPAPLFDHGATPFPLTGKHVPVDCAKCHEPAAVTVYSGVAHQTCTACHQDPHAGTLGADCASCHTTAGWLQISGSSFDHGRTRYPLLGQHQKVECGKCHSQGRKKPAFARCDDCHRDVHEGAALKRSRLTACEDCHTVQGFRPSSFTMTRHDLTAFPLQGAHLATPCSACHQTTAKKAFQLAVRHAACTDCHRDPHPESMARLSPNRNQGCAACHTQANWRVPDFDHTVTGFRLDGRHAGAACASCHKSGDKTNYSGLATTCAACHEDVHRGQFAQRTTPDGKQVACDQCHVTADWFAEKFDHEKDSRFPLRGGHERVACVKCHTPVNPGNDRLLKFKPLPVTCKECHTGAFRPTSKGEGS